MRAAAIVAIAALASAPACKGKDPAPEQAPLAELEAQWPPHTPTCRSWEDLDDAALPALPSGAHVEAFDQVWRIVAEKHYDPTLACLDWIALREHFAAKIAEAGDDAGAAYAAINELLALLNQSHLHASAPSSALASARTRDTGPATVPIKLRWLPLEPGSTQRRAVVVDDAVGGQPSGIPRGAIVTAIAGESVDELAREIADAKQGSRATELAFSIARTLDMLLSCPAEGRKRIAFLDPQADDAPRELEVPCFVPEGERMSLGNLRDLPTTVEWRLIEPEATTTGEASEKPIGYLAFNFWMLPMVERIQAGVDELRAAGIDGLVIDLRGNPGGVGAMSIPVARMLVREGGSLGRLQMREFDQEFKLAPNPEAFAGPVAILVDEGTASTSEIFAVGLRDIGRVVIVGDGPSAGMALPSMIETLPDGGMIQYVVGDYHSARGTVAEGDGVVPELRVEETRVDHVAGRDGVLEAAVARLRNNE
jgi:carboxyl-terminal processing protease